ncbi:MAG: HD domain-containing protein [Solobacterium sp.]|nr:HD domain-containing protein [Solobacterium sp.]
MLFLQEHQLNIMLFMSGICGILAVLTAIPRTLSPKRKSILAMMEVASMLLLLFDRAAYLYRGDLSELGGMMVRFSNGMVYFMQVFIPHLVTRYMYDLFREEGRLGFTPKRLRICEGLFFAGTALVIISQFTGLYYTFDEMNNYQRAPGFVLCYIIPLTMVVLQESVLIQYRDHLDRVLAAAMIISIALPTLMSFVQIFCYGLSLTNITMVFMVIVFFIYALSEMNRSVEQAQRNEIESYKEAERRERVMFEQTSEALANAIDAKDRYTHGHSARVALYSRKIAERAGYSKEQCGQVYYAALLHDIGKIGIHEDILNKEGKLSDEEFAEIKKHPVYGYQILSGIHQSPYLSIGAHYHHERYDGRGYPDGLAGEEIPEFARIISVADAYDAMTSSRSYREPISAEKVREELVKGMGTQFDPRFAKIMLEMIDENDLPQK